MCNCKKNKYKSKAIQSLVLPEAINPLPQEIQEELNALNNNTPQSPSK